MMENEDKTYLKFLKNRDMNRFKVGYYLPKEIILNNNEKVNIEWIKELNNSTIFFVMSSYCSVCNLKEIEIFINRYPFFNYVLFYECKDNQFLEVREKFKNITIYRCEALKLQEQLEFDLYPCSIGINSIGQVVSCGLFNDFKKIEQLMFSLIESKKNE
ncbi:MAG: hypothetical protein AB9856_13880 [Cellulosilyticaceae bacterium]